MIESLDRNTIKQFTRFINLIALSYNYIESDPSIIFENKILFEDVETGIFRDFEININ